MNTLIFKILTISFYTTYVVNGQQECRVFNFEDDLEETLTDCESSDPWQHGDYASISIRERPENLIGGTRFITPTSDGSCGSIAENIHVHTGGTFEVNFYIETLEESTSGDANACIEIYERNENYWISTDCIVLTEFEDGWHHLYIDTNNDVDASVFLRCEAFDSFFFLIDSLRYVNTIEECSIYDGEDGSDGENGEDGGNSNDDEECFIINFEDALIEILTECENSDSWEYGSYADIVIQERPENLIGGTRFITPTSDGSCGSTAENIHVRNEGILEVNFYIETLEENMSDDPIACVDIYESNENEWISTDCIFRADFEDGWHHMDINTNNDVVANVLLRGNGMDGIRFLIDSLRYLKSDTIGECSIYEDEEDENGGGVSEDSGEDTEEHETTEDSDEAITPDPPDGVPTENGGLSAGAIAGIVIGAVVFVIVVGILAYFVGLKQGNKKISSPPQYNETQTYAMDLPRPMSVPRARAISPQPESSDVYPNNNNDPHVYKLEIHNHFSR